MNYTECLQALAELGTELRGVRFDLEAIRAILEALGHPERKHASVIVAGTNGKGSTSAILASILECAGYRTGLYTSPHLVRVNERIRVNSREISDDEFAASFSDVWEAAKKLLASKVLARRPSFFEFLTAAAFLHFARAGVAFAVLEVGMGGRLDATNVSEPRLAVITDIGLDHQAYLGSTIAAIAGEKAGAMRAGRPVISACTDPEAAEVIRRRARELGAPLVEIPDFARFANVRRRDGLCSFDLSLNGDCYSGLTSPLAGRFQVRNAAAAVTAARQLALEGFAVPRLAIIRGLQRAYWPGRLETISSNPLVVLDGAHNPAAAREIAAFVREEWPGRALRLVYASMRDKAIAEISGILFPLAEEVYLTRPDQPRAAAPEEIVAAAESRTVKTHLEPDPVEAVQKARRASSSRDVILVTGSLFLVGAVKRALREGSLVLPTPSDPASAAPPAGGRPEPR